MSSNSTDRTSLCLSEHGGVSGYETNSPHDPWGFLNRQSTELPRGSPSTHVAKAAGRAHRDQVSSPRPPSSLVAEPRTGFLSPSPALYPLGNTASGLNTCLLPARTGMAITDTLHPLLQAASPELRVFVPPTTSSARHLLPTQRDLICEGT